MLALGLLGLGLDWYPRTGHPALLWTSCLAPQYSDWQCHSAHRASYPCIGLLECHGASNIRGLVELLTAQDRIVLTRRVGDGPASWRGNLHTPFIRGHSRLLTSLDADNQFNILIDSCLQIVKNNIANHFHTIYA